MNAASSEGDVSGHRPGSAGPLSWFCDAVDAINYWVGLIAGSSIIVVTFAVTWEVVSRSAFGQPTIWSNETSIYVSAATYLIAGGYGLLYNRHVRIDVLYGALSERTQTRLDVLTLLLTLGYAGALIWVGGNDFYTAFSQGETTGTPWNPPIWPVKLAIPVAGSLIALQAVANTLRRTGLAPTKEAK
ncbi:MAG: TRAP transporter small permease subunit [Hyphomicrobiaceae bacterium]|nr:TRAP transporter small permease subunit [Hyphomicrobiaceae bacterium]